MKNMYHSDIMQFLLRAGRDGMHIAQLSRLVYNVHANLFNRELKFDELHQMIRSYLWRQSRMRRSPFTRVRHGYYAIKPNIAIQLDFCFNEIIEEEEILARMPKMLSTPDNHPRQLTLFES